MSRTRVHNLFVSLDGYAAGEDVTFDAPIGGAAAALQLVRRPRHPRDRPGR